MKCMVRALFELFFLWHYFQKNYRNSVFSCFKNILRTLLNNTIEPFINNNEIIID